MTKTPQQPPFTPQRWIRRLRKRHRLNQTQFGIQIGGACTESVHFWETGKSLPNRSYRENIACRFDMDVAQVDRLVEKGDFEE